MLTSITSVGRRKKNKLQLIHGWVKQLDVTQILNLQTYKGESWQDKKEIKLKLILLTILTVELPLHKVNQPGYTVCCVWWWKKFL